MVLFLCILAGVAALLLGLLWRITIRFRVQILGLHIRAWAEISVFYGIIRIPVDTEGSLPLLAYRKNDKKRSRKKPKRKLALTALLRHGWKTKALRLSQLTCRGMAGRAEDAYFSVMAAGALQSVLSLLLCAVSPACRGEVEIRPSFMRDVFWLYVEGILEIVPTQIISVLLKVRKQGGKT